MVEVNGIRETWDETGHLTIRSQSVRADGRLTNRTEARQLATMLKYYFARCPVCREEYAAFEAGQYGIPVPDKERRMYQSACARTQCQEEAKRQSANYRASP